MCVGAHVDRVWIAGSHLQSRGLNTVANDMPGKLVFVQSIWYLVKERGLDDLLAFQKQVVIAMACQAK